LDLGLFGLVDLVANLEAVGLAIAALAFEAAVASAGQLASSTGDFEQLARTSVATKGYSPLATASTCIG
jgi:hypothetical protein